MKAEFAFSELSPAFASGATASSLAVSGSTSPTAGILGWVDSCTHLAIEAEIQQDTGGVLDVYIQSRINGTWCDMVHYPQVPVGTGTSKYYVAMSGSSYSPTPIQVGTGLTPALPSNTVVPGPWGDVLRLVMVPGATTVGGFTVVVRVVGQAPNRLA